MNQSDLENRFAYHPASDEQRKTDHENVRYYCKELAINLNEILPEGREKSTAITKLEEVMFWANAAIARPPQPAVGLTEFRTVKSPVVYPHHNHRTEEWCGYECPWRQQFDGKSS